MAAAALLWGCADRTSPSAATPSGFSSSDAAVPSSEYTGEAAPSGTAAGSPTRIRPVDGKAMVFVPEGEFLMGSAADNPDADPIEKPEHTVYLNAFWIDVTETTNAQFRACVEAGICKAPAACDFGSLNYSDAEKADHPAACVTWFDAVDYCDWVGGRLPTEAEWEKAARGTGGRTYAWRETIDCLRGNFRGCQDFIATAPVGSFPAGVSPYGALDMAGNVWEWVGDWMGWEYYGISPRANPAEPESGDMRVATRHCAPPDHRADALGFRCAIQ